jgi:DNA repair protein RecO (recombination protein O)
MALRHDQGIVLRGFPFGEADRVVVLLSPNHGKLRTVAKGVRKTKSRFGGRLEPLTHVDVVLYEGRNLDTITQVSVIESFPALRRDLDRVASAGAMASVADLVAQEGEPSHRLFLLLQRALRVLEAGATGPAVLAAYYLKLADVLGLTPALRSCAGCGSDVADPRFSFAGGGVVCDRCAPAGAVRLRAGMTEYLAGLFEGEIGTAPDGDDIAAEAQGLARRFLEFHLERRIGGLAVPNG